MNTDGMNWITKLNGFTFSITGRLNQAKSFLGMGNTTQLSMNEPSILFADTVPFPKEICENARRGTRKLTDSGQDSGFTIHLCISKLFQQGPEPL